MDTMEQLLCPQVSMDVEERQLEIDNSTAEPDIPPEADPETLPEELRLRMILDNGFDFSLEQIPHDLTKMEEGMLEKVCKSDPNFIKYIETCRLHCTVCNKHMGSACVNQYDRYIHPELNVLMCHACYKFYGTGAFEKDVDGSELYCKWCGQGGTVMCCSACPFVFCSLCVRRNLGTPMVNKIKSSDTWKCFVCEPHQLSYLHLAVHILHEFSKEQIKRGIVLRDMNLLAMDQSRCCIKTKRKRRVDDDEYDEYVPLKQKPRTVKKTSILKKPATTLINKAVKSIHQQQQLRKIAPATEKNQGTTSNQSLLLRVGPNIDAPTLAHILPNLFAKNQSSVSGRLHPTAPIVITRTSNNADRGVQSVSQSIAPQRRKQNVAPLPISLLKKSNPSNGAVPPLTPVHGKAARALRTAWLNNALQSTYAACNALMRQTREIEGSIQDLRNYSQLAVKHNNMQNAIAQCTKSLTDTRKRMHSDFLKYLSKMNVQHTSRQRATGFAGENNAASTTSKLSASSSLTNAIPTEAIDLCDDDDDDVEGQREEKDPLAIDDVDLEGYESLEENSFGMLAQSLLDHTAQNQTKEATKNVVVHNEASMESCISILSNSIDGDDGDDVIEINDSVPETETDKSKGSGKSEARSLRLRSANVYKECIIANSKIPFNTEELSLDEFMRAIRVRTIIDTVNTSIDNSAHHQSACSYNSDIISAAKQQSIDAKLDVNATDSSHGCEEEKHLNVHVENAVEELSSTIDTAHSPAENATPSATEGSTNVLETLETVQESHDETAPRVEKSTSQSVITSGLQDVDSNDNLKTVDSAADLPAINTPSTPAQMCLDDMIQIYETDQSMITSNMKPADK